MAAVHANSSLLVIVGQPLREDHVDLILARITEGLTNWDAESGLTADTELLNFINTNAHADRTERDEIIVRHRGSTYIEVLVNPTVGLLSDSLRHFLTDSPTYKLIIHAGPVVHGNGSWLMNDGTFSFHDFARLVHAGDVQAAIHGNSAVKVVLSCIPEGEWSSAGAKHHHINSCLRVGVLSTDGAPPLTCAVNWRAYLAQYVRFRPLDDLLPSTDVVGNLSFNRPTFYVFPAGQGDASLLGLSGFTLLVDGGYSRKCAFWNILKHFDRLDALLITRLSASNVLGASSFLRRVASTGHPKLGWMYMNSADRKLGKEAALQHPLVVSLQEEGHAMRGSLTELGLRPQPLVVNPAAKQQEQIVLYQKVGHGQLGMYVLSPAKDSKELKEFTDQWQNVAAAWTPGKFSVTGTDPYPIPLAHSVSVAVLLVWQPSDPEDAIVRILLPGSCPQERVLQGLERLKGVDYLKHSTCSAQSLASDGRGPPVKKPAAQQPQHIASSAKSTASTTSQHTAPHNNSSTAAQMKQPQTGSSAHNVQPGHPHAPVATHTANAPQLVDLTATPAHNSTARPAPTLANDLVDITQDEPKSTSLAAAASTHAREGQTPNDLWGIPDASVGAAGLSPSPQSPVVPPTHPVHVEAAYENRAFAPHSPILASPDTSSAVHLHYTPNADTMTPSPKRDDHVHFEHTMSGSDVGHLPTGTTDANMSPQEDSHVSQAHKHAHYASDEMHNEVKFAEAHNTQRGSFSVPDSDEFGGQLLDGYGHHHHHEGSQNGFPHVHASANSAPEQEVPRPTVDQLKQDWGEPLGLPPAPIPPGKSNGATGKDNKAPAGKASAPAKSASESSKAATAKPAMTASKVAATAKGAAAPVAAGSKAPTAGTSRPSSGASTAAVAPAAKKVAATHSATKPTGTSPAKTAGTKPPTTAAGTKTTTMSASTKPTSTTAAPAKKTAFVPSTPFHLDLVYVPHFGNPHYTDSDFFKFVRSRYYVLSGLHPAREVLDALIAGKKQWHRRDEEVTVIPTYDTDVLQFWMALNKDTLEEEHIEVAPAAIRCTLSLHDQFTSCAAYRLEF